MLTLFADSIRFQDFVPYHFPASAIGLAAWLAFLKALREAEGRPSRSKCDGIGRKAPTGHD
jgi:hypothetical protein